MKNSLFLICTAVLAASCQAAAGSNNPSQGVFADSVSGATFTKKTGALPGNLRFSPNGDQVSIGTGGKNSDATTRATYNSALKKSGTQAVYGGSKVSGSLNTGGSYFGFALDGKTVTLAPYSGVDSAEAVDFAAANAGTFSK